MNATFNIRRGRRLWVVLAVAAVVFVAYRATRQSRPGAAHGSAQAQRLVAVLQYLQRDYPAAVASHDERELDEQRQFASDADALARAGGVPAEWTPRVASVDERVHRGVDPEGVSAACGSLVDDLTAKAGITRAPAAPPDLAKGGKLFAQACAGCHGATGRGDGPAAASLHPPPADFQSPAVMDDLTPFRAYSALRFGLRGTAMPAFDAMDDADRWALAFYLFSLRQPACDAATRAPSPGLEELANRSDAELARSAGPGAVACLRRRMPELDVPLALTQARVHVEQAAELARRADRDGAGGALLSAYLTDIEPVEPVLRARDATAMSDLEGAFTTARAAVHGGDARAPQDLARLTALLDRAARDARHAPAAHADAKGTFALALLVIVREGFEATVIVAALLAVLKKRRLGTRARYVHAGWLSAIAVGAAVFAIGRSVLAGANDEKLEGCLAFVAVAMLLYAALWLNSRSTTRRMMGELRERTDEALQLSGAALFGVAFLAAFRESFETAVFLEALAVDGSTPVVWGATAGAALLAALVVSVNRLGMRLPMQTLFRVSTVALLATAVVLVGQGIHAFQTIGWLSASPFGHLRVEFLGVYPDRIGLSGQLVLAVLPFVWSSLTTPSKGVPSGLKPAE